MKHVLLLKKVTQQVVTLFFLFCLTYSYAQAQSILYVDISASGNNNGTSWSDAYTDLQDALSVANTKDTIWVATGTYYPTPTADRTISFQIPDSVAVYGGFAGSETQRNQRNWEINETILSGDIGVEDDSTDNSYHVVLFDHVTAQTLLDGFTITRGNASQTGYDPHSDGGGIYNDGTSSSEGSNPQITNCLITKNISTDRGAGIYNNGENGKANPAITHCTFTGNLGSEGGAIHNNGRTGECNPTIEYCIFSGNYATNGAAMNNYNVQGTTNPVITNCSFIGNNGVHGAVMHNYTYQGVVSPQLTNCLIWGNRSVSNNAAPVYSYCNIEGSGGSANWNTALGTDDGNNLDSLPLVEEMPDYNNAPVAALNMQIRENSPCVDAGDPASPLDPDGSQADIGARHPLIAFAGDQTDLANFEVVLPEPRTFIAPHDIRIRLANLNPEDTIYSWRAQIKLDNNDLGDSLITQPIIPMDTVEMTIRKDVFFDEGVHVLKVWVFPETGSDVYHPNDTLETTIRTLPYLDVGISQIESPKAIDTAGSYDINVYLTNYHEDSTIHTANIYYQINGGQEKLYQFNGALNPQDTIGPITLGNEDFSAGEFTVEAWTESNDEYTDTLMANNKAAKEISIVNYLLQGTFSIGSSDTCDFSSFSEAIDTLKLGGLTGPVTFRVDSSYYTEQVTLENYSGNNQYPVIFEGATNDRSDAVLTSSGTTLKFETTASGKTVQNIVFRNMTISSNGGIPVQFGWGDIKNISLENNILSSAQADQNIIQFRYDDVRDSIRIQNNLISGGNQGIVLTTGVNLNAMQVLNNHFTGQSIHGMYFSDNTHSQHVVVENNTFDSNDPIYGVYAQGIDVFEAHNNRIDLPAGGTGIYLNNSEGGQGTGLAHITNNFIRIHTTEADKGISAYADTVKVFYNTVYMTGDNQESVCLYENGYYAHAYFSAYNNNLVNLASGKALSLDADIASDNNNLYSNGPVMVSYTFDLASMVTHQAYHKIDSNSVSVPVPVYSSDSSLYAESVYLEGKATPLSDYNIDIDGDPRDVTHPDIGADEFIPSSSPLTGTYTLGSGGDFTSFAETLDSLITYGAKDSVIIQVLPGTYQEQVTIPTLPDLSQNNRVIFQSSTLDSLDVTLTFTPQTGDELHTLRFAGTEFVEFKYMTITTGHTERNEIVQIADLASNNRLFSNRIMALAINQTGIGGQPFAENRIDKNTLIGGSKGIHLEGTDFMGFSNDSTHMTRLIGNTLYQQTDTAINLRNNLCPVIQGNSIYASDSSIVGIFLEENNQTTILANRISLLNGGTGIYLDPYYGYDYNLVANNEVFVNTGQPDAAIELITTGSTDKFDVVHNTLLIKGDNTSSYCIKANDDHSSIRIQNNILVNQAYGNTLNQNFNSNYNCLFTNGQYIAFTVSELNEWHDPYGHTLSISHNPVFQSDSVLSPLNPRIDGKGLPLSEVTTDIHGNARDGANPDMGAYEYTGYSNPMSGVYSIGLSGADFESFNEAVDSLIVHGIEDSVIMEVQPGIYEEQVRIPQIEGTLSTQTVAFQSQTHDSTDVQLSFGAKNETHNYTLGLEGADHFIFEHMGIHSTDSTYNNSVVLKDSSQYNVFQNNLLEGYPVNSADANHSLFYIPGKDNLHTTLLNNRFLNGGYSIHKDGSGTDTLVVHGNHMIRPFHGIRVNHSDSRITGNQIILNDSIPDTERYGLDASANTFFANNFVSIKNAAKSYGIYNTADTINIYYNTIHIYGKDSSATAGLYFINQKANLYNNLVINNTGGYLYAIANTIDTSLFHSDYNGFFSDHPEPFDNRREDQWQGTYERDQHSFFHAVDFASDTNLHVWDPYPNNSGTPLAEVITDIDGESRSSVHPDIGADEFGFPDPLSGIYTIDSTGGDFISFSAAVDSMAAYGLSGHVIFEAVDGIYNDQVEIPEIPMASENNTATFRAQAGDSTRVTLQYEATPDKPYTVKLDGADYISFEHMTVAGTNDSLSRVVLLEGGARHNRLENNIVTAPGQMGSLVYSPPTEADSANVIQNNYMEGGQFGVYFEGNGSAAEEQANILRGNQIINTKSGGIMTKYQAGMEISGNRIIKTTLNQNDWAGIWLENNTKENLVANNMISVHSEYICGGIVLKNTENQLIHHNSILITGNASESRALEHSGDVSHTANIIRNNILANQAGGLAMTTKMNDPGHDNLNTDYNVFYTNGNQLFYNIDHFVADLATWQSESGRDAQSFQADPGYVSATDLHLFNMELDNKGTPLAEVTTDIDGDSRDDTNPDIGADEYQAQPLSGTYSIEPASGDYPDFSSALADMQLFGISGKVTFEVYPGRYHEQLHIHDILRASQSDSILFASSEKDSTQVILEYEATHADSNYVVCLDGESRISFTHMTLKAAGDNYGRVIEMKNGTHHNRFLNNIIESTQGEDNTLKALVFSGKDDPANDTLNLFENNVFTNGSYGIYLAGVNYGNQESGTRILNNDFEDQSHCGMYLYYQDEPLIGGNTIQAAPSGEYYGMYLETCYSKLTVQKNKLDINGTGDATGIYLLNSSSETGAEGTIANNFVRVNTTAATSGIWTNSHYQNVDYNSIHVTGNSTTSAGLYAANTYSAFRNNILANTAGGFALVLTTSSSDVLDYNNYHTSGNSLVQVNGVAYNDLDSWKAAYTQHNNASLSEDPAFISESDLHLILPAMDSAGTYISGISEDIDGDMRDASYPDIGADEFESLSLNLEDEATGCLGDVVLLEAAAGFDSYLWSTGEETRTIEITYQDMTQETEYFSVTGSIHGTKIMDSTAVTFYNPVANAGNDTTSCHGESITLEAQTSLDCQWYHETMGLISQSAQMTHTFDNMEHEGTSAYEIDFVLRVTQHGCEDYDTLTIRVYATPEKPDISEENGLLVCSVEGTDYEWFLNGNRLEVHTQSIDPQEEGNYTVQVSNGSCLSELSEAYEYLEDVGIFKLSATRWIKIHPNPAKGHFFIRLKGIEEPLMVKLINMQGQLIRTYRIDSHGQQTTNPLDVSGVSGGMYMLHMQYGDHHLTSRLIIR